MKRILRVSIIVLLSVGARLVLRKYRPKIVMVTGSVGKTTTKDAIAAALSARFYLRKSEKSYNTEFGLPFTVIGVANPWANPFAWFGVVKELFVLLLLPNHYPKLLVLEVGADRPGDLMRILRIASPDAVVVTRLPNVPVHVEAYPTPVALREEEFAPAYALSPDAPLILASRDEHARMMAKRLPVRVHTYGFAEDADVKLSDAGFYLEEGEVAGMKAHVMAKEGEGDIIVRGAVGEHQLVPAASALTTALALGIPFTEAMDSLAHYEPPPGRGRIFKGTRGSFLIDDSYNASPAAEEEALKTLAAFPHAGRRIAVLADMLELGRYSVVEHERLGALAATHADILVTVGIRARAAAAAAKKAGMPDFRVFSYGDVRDAVPPLQEMLGEGDVVLIKGSQSLRTERIVEALLADPGDAAKLVRQDLHWKRIP